MGIKEVVIGMEKSGRIKVMRKVMGKKKREILNELKGG